MSMTSNRPYFLRAIFEWLLDNQCTPHLVVFAKAVGVSVPQQHVDKEGQIILNISPSAVKDLFISNDAVTFNARFSGIVHSIYVPCGAVLGIYGRENGQGMVFEFEEPTAPPPPEPTTPTPSSVSSINGGKFGGDSSKRASLKVVK